MIQQRMSVGSGCDLIPCHAVYVAVRLKDCITTPTPTAVALQNHSSSDVVFFFSGNVSQYFWAFSQSGSSHKL